MKLASRKTAQLFLPEISRFLFRFIIFAIIIESTNQSSKNPLLKISFIFFEKFLDYKLIFLSLKATDRDEINSQNSNISYCIVDDNDNCINHTHFHINQSGAVSCIKELDYEELSVSSRGKAGELRLRIKACDHGNSPLCSTVNLTTFVQVKEKTMYEISFVILAIFLSKCLTS